MNFEGFSTVEFPPINPDVPGFVYVWCWINGSEEVPFYVGQTGRLWGRLDDYYWAMFSAPTDFRVGEAIRYLSARGYRITVKYKSSAAPLEEEAKIKAALRKHYELLNDRGFDWRQAEEPEERRKVQEFFNYALAWEARLIPKLWRRRRMLPRPPIPSRLRCAPGEHL